MDSQRLIYKVRVGSHAYGMNTQTSDEDFAGIFIQPIEYFFGLKAFDQQNEQSEEVDSTLYSLRKYANLAIANNPNVLELMFVDPSDMLLVTTEMSQLLNIRKSFLSQKCKKTYLGYASAQLHRIRVHQRWIGQEFEAMKILQPLAQEGFISQDWVEWRFGKNMVTRLKREFANRARNFSNEQTKLGRPNLTVQDTYLEPLKNLGIVCPQEEDPQFWSTHRVRGQVFMKHLYDAAKKQRDQYVTWMAERNPLRHDMEVKFGYDTKHAAHLVRLLRMGYEILTEGEVRVKRPDAAELLAIRQGSMTFEEITAYADDMIAKIEAITNYAVPEQPDYDLVNKTIIDMTQKALSAQ
jgi:predicted nucleotidyltransferase